MAESQQQFEEWCAKNGLFKDEQGHWQKAEDKEPDELAQRIPPYGADGD